MIETKFKSKIYLLLLATVFIAFGCKNQDKGPEPQASERQYLPEKITETEKNTFSTQKEKSQQSDETVNGNYEYEGTDAKCRIVILGSQWTGSFTFVSGFGAEYDASQAEFQSGVVRGNGIFDESGLVKIGNIEGKSLTTTVGGQYISLKKK